MSNIQTVQSMYEAFGRSDIPALLSHLAENVEWDYGMTVPGVPWLQPRHGRAEVPGFFESLGGVEFQKFEPKTLLESGSVVVVLIDVAFVVKATGRTVVEEDEIHIWDFDTRGQVARFRHKLDTHQHWVACRGE